MHRPDDPAAEGGPAAEGDLTATLELAGWRRRIAELYADVRALAEEDPTLAWRHWVEVRERLYRTHPSSPVRAADRPTFRARHFPYDPRLRFEVEVVPEVSDGPRPGLTGGGPGGGLGGSIGGALAIPNSGTEALAFRRVGSVELPLPEGPRRLGLFWLQAYAGGLFLPFRDATNGNETYGAGRYLLDAAKSADLGGDPGRRTLILDLNFAYQPSCAFDPRWACPLAPPENRLDVAIRAGERIA
jgi:uncharacterized protein (DUF1684 family)